MKFLQEVAGGIIMVKAVNDATEQKAGDIYQYIIALRDCFELDGNDTLQIEVNGDVSIISEDSGKFQKEVKHHFGKTFLGDRDIDFWKTLANWYEDYERIKSFRSLILYSTSDIKMTSPFYGWNGLAAENKLAKIEEIGSVTKSREKGFREQYTRIFNEEYNKDQLLEILSKFTIEASRTNIVGISGEFSKFIGHIPKENRDSYIGALLGRIMILLKNPPHRWEVSRTSFDKMLQDESAAYGDARSKPLPTEFAQGVVPSDKESALREKQFVKAIMDIDYPQMIPSAVQDYWKTDMTIAKYFRDDFTYLSSLEMYKEDLSQKLMYEKEEKKLDAEGKSPAEKEQISKRLYLEAMRWAPVDFGSIIRNQGFFQHGVIHNIVDDGDFEWKVGDEDEHPAD